ncbi:ParB N-terminal domain-containing protein [Tolypothrix bouteillei VB521301_2]|uniref:ParB N-terminal domain-containing protein n=1 Tax=Tolypothrix bouteillei TaxID=1246981 RepID=UPI0038B66421
MTSELIQTKARLLKKYGQITPIILVPQDNKRYMLLDGQLRTEAAKNLGWQKICVLIVPTPEDLSSKSTSRF